MNVIIQTLAVSSVVIVTIKELFSPSSINMFVGIKVSVPQLTKTREKGRAS